MTADLHMLKSNLNKALLGLSDEPYHRRDISNLAMLANPEPIFYAMVRLLSIGEIQDDYSSLEYLRSTYMHYVSEHRNCNFTFDDLFEEGWLVKSIGEWHFIGFRSNYGHLTDVDMREESICKFIASLPYNRETGLVHVDITGDSFIRLSQEINRDYTWFVENELFSSVENNTNIYALAESSELWKKLGNKALGVARSQGMELERVLRLAHALQLYPSPSDLPAGDSDEHKTLLDMLAHDSFDWGQVGQILLTACHLQYHCLGAEQKQNIAMPSTTRLRHFWLWHIVYEPLCHLPRGTWQDIIFYYFLHRYNTLGDIDKQRFCRLICHPFYQIKLVESHVLEPLIDCLADEPLFLAVLLPLTEDLQVRATDVSPQASTDLLAYLWKLNPAPEEMAEYLIFLSTKDTMVGRGNKGYAFLYRNLISRIKDSGTPALIQGCLNHVVGQIDGASAVDLNHYYLLLLDLSWAVKRLPVAERQENYEKIYQAVIRWGKRNQADNLLLSTLSENSWERADWPNILRANLIKATEFFDNIESVLKVDELQNVQHGKLAECYLRLGLLWLACLSQHSKFENLDSIQVKYVQFFFSSHEKLHLFSGDYLGIFRSEETLAMILNYYPQFCYEARDTFSKLIKTIDDTSCVDLIIWFPYIESQDLQEVFLERLQLILSSVQKHVCFLPTLRTLADNLVEIGLGLRETEKQTDTLRKIVESLKDIQTTFEITRPKLVGGEDNYNKWIDSLKDYILLLEDKWDELDKNEFYRAYHCLHLGDLKSLREAERILSSYFENGEVGYAFNYMVVEALLVESLIERKDSYAEDLEKFYSTIDFLQKNIERIKPNLLWQIAYYKLKVSIMVDEAVDIYECFWSLERRYRLDINCASLMAEFLLKQKDYSLLKDIIEKLKIRYGDSDDINKLAARITQQKEACLEDAGEQLTHITISPNTEKDIVGYVRGALDDFGRMSTYQKAEVMLRPQVDLAAAAQYATDANSCGLVELFVLRTVLDVASWVEAYSDRLIFNNKTSPEDTYNKLVAGFLESYGWLFLHYNAYDQTQEGSRSDAKNGHKTSGELDIMLKWKGRPVAILEGIKLDQKGAFSSSVGDHIDKLPDYNRRNIKLAFMLVYATASDMDCFVNKYTNSLRLLKTAGKCSIQEIKTSEDLGGTLFELEPYGISFVCTKHLFSEKGFDRGKEMYVYHIFIQIQKSE